MPWVMRIAHNLVIDHFRKQKKMQMIRSNNDFDIFDVIKDSKINADEKLIATCHRSRPQHLKR